MSYDNPKRIVDKRMQGMIQSGGKSGIARTIAGTAKEMSSHIKAQKEQVAKQQAIVDNEMQSMYSMANKFGSTGDDKLDTNINGFWNGKVDDYFQIKNQMQDGSISRQEGNLALAKIQGLVPQFKEQVQYLSQQTNDYATALKNGTLSSTGSMKNKTMIQTLMEKGDVQLSEVGGDIYFFKPNEGQEGFDETKNSFLNGKEMISMKNQEQDLFNHKADISQLTTTLANKIGTPDGPSSYYETIKLKKGDPDPFHPGSTIENIPDGQEYTYQTLKQDKRGDYISEMENSPMTQTIMKDETRMLSVFQDEIQDGYSNGKIDPTATNSIAGILTAQGIDEATLLSEAGVTMEEMVNSSWHESPSGLTTEQEGKLKEYQDLVGRKYIAQKAFDDNVDSDGIGKLIGKANIIEPATDSENINNTSTKLTDLGGKSLDAAAIQSGIGKEETIFSITRKGQDMLKGKAADDQLKIRKNLSVDYPGIEGDDYNWVVDNQTLEKALLELEFSGYSGGVGQKGGYSKFQFHKKDFNNWSAKGGKKTVDDYLK